MDPFTIAALIAAVVGAGVQYKASSDSQQRQREAIAAGLEKQRQSQTEAEKMAMDQAQDFAPEKRKENQAAIAAEIEQNLIAPVSEANVIRNQQTTTQGDVSGDYSTAKAQSDANVLKDAQSLARIFGKTGSASRLRVDEALKMAETGMNIDRISNFARGNAAASQIAVQQAGQVDPGMVLAGSLLQAGGTAGLMSGGSAAAKQAGGSGLSATASTSASASSPFAATTAGHGFGGTSTVGFKIPKSFVW
jgi:hypothetical protein